MQTDAYILKAATAMSTAVWLFLSFPLPIHCWVQHKGEQVALCMCIRALTCASFFCSAYACFQLGLQVFRVMRGKRGRNGFLPDGVLCVCDPSYGFPLRTCMRVCGFDRLEYRGTHSPIGRTGEKLLIPVLFIVSVVDFCVCQIR